MVKEIIEKRDDESVEHWRLYAKGGHGRPDVWISDQGGVRGRKVQTDKNGYLYIHCNRKHVSVHRAVAELFVMIPHGKEQNCVDHFDGDKTNNKATNLHWVTPFENTHNPLTFEKFKKARCKPVLCVELNKIFESASEASNQLGINRPNICEVCRGTRKTAGGLHWRYVENKQEEN